MAKHLVITGANRGIGLSFVEHYLKQGWQVSACCRQPDIAPELSLLKDEFGRLNVYELDVSKPEGIELLLKRLPNQPIDLLINNAGHYGPKGLSFGSIDLEEWRSVLEVNTLAPLMITQALFSRLKRSHECVLAFISSKVGSMADNSSGGGYYYRSSKAALNSVVKSLAIDLHADGIKCVALHPGWVRTEMGGPNALIAPAASVQGMAMVIGELSDAQSGEFLDYQGNSIPW
ncbi:SDR family oxidoreductase [Shewanella marinintestina]|uniref:SDR family oxidoreductase n=1 Tax=Shewanella marinintestina TaxID=190305 RepID=UPI00200CF4F5|nr:SDR family oxidoreductase [Shewanella marinintestina]MCL1144434.1 SDR family oxidoreductase [Shewanella marinintestina]